MTARRHITPSEVDAIITERDALRTLVDGLQRLLVAYRTGRAPSEATFAKVAKARTKLAGSPWGDKPAPIEGETLGDYRARIGAAGSDTQAATSIRWVNGAWALAAGTVKP